MTPGPKSEAAIRQMPWSRVMLLDTQSLGGIVPTHQDAIIAAHTATCSGTAAPRHHTRLPCSKHAATLAHSHLLRDGLTLQQAA